MRRPKYLFVLTFTGTPFKSEDNKNIEYDCYNTNECFGSSSEIRCFSRYFFQFGISLEIIRILLNILKFQDVLVP